VPVGGADRAALKKIIVPVRVQSGYEYDGWLRRTVLIGLLFFDITRRNPLPRRWRWRTS
jgi:hypothetical protein